MSALSGLPLPCSLSWLIRSSSALALARSSFLCALRASDFFLRESKSSCRDRAGWPSGPSAFLLARSSSIRAFKRDCSSSGFILGRLKAFGFFNADSAVGVPELSWSTGVSAGGITEVEDVAADWFADVSRAEGISGVVGAVESAASAARPETSISSISSPPSSLA